MRGTLPGNGPDHKKIRITEEESRLLISKKFTCHACQSRFNATTADLKRILRDKADIDLCPRFIDVDAIKYMIIECPVCGYADFEKDFITAGPNEIKLYNEQNIKPASAAPLDETFRDYESGYRHYKSALKCEMVCESAKGKRGYTIMLTAWLIRRWREEMELLGEIVTDQDTMSEIHEKKMLRSAIKNYLEALKNEKFPIYGITEPTFNYMLAALYYETDEPDKAEYYMYRALYSNYLKTELRDKAEELMLKLKK